MRKKKAKSSLGFYSRKMKKHKKEALEFKKTGASFSEKQRSEIKEMLKNKEEEESYQQCAGPLKRLERILSHFRTI